MQIMWGRVTESDGLTSLTTSEPLQPEDSAKITPSRAELVARLDVGLLTRAQVLRAISDSDEVFQIEFNRAFVAMQYYGYLASRTGTGWLQRLAHLLECASDGFPRDGARLR